MLNIAQHVAFHEGKSVAIFSLEMSKEQLVNRLLSLESKVNSQAIRTGNMKDDEWGTPDRERRCDWKIRAF